MGRRQPLLFASLSDTGRVRAANEDACGHVRIGERQIFVTADGMGGEVGGNLASETAVKIICDEFRRDIAGDPRSLLERAFEKANREILSLQETNPELRGMGTTAVAVVLDDDGFIYAHVGDSRLYLIRDSEIPCLTEDHTVVQQMINGGLISPAQAKTHPERHVLNRVLGREQQLDIDVSPSPEPIGEGDFLVLSTDGVTDLLEDDEIRRLVMEYGPGRGVEEIVGLANQRGGADNATVQVIYCGEPRKSWDPRGAAVTGSAVSRPSTLVRALRGLGTLCLVLAVGAVLGWLIATSGNSRAKERRGFDENDAAFVAPQPSENGEARPGFDRYERVDEERRLRASEELAAGQSSASLTTSAAQGQVTAAQPLKPDAAASDNQASSAQGPQSAPQPDSTHTASELDPVEDQGAAPGDSTPAGVGQIASSGERKEEGFGQDPAEQPSETSASPLLPKSGLRTVDGHGEAERQSKALRVEPQAQAGAWYDEELATLREACMDLSRYSQCSTLSEALLKNTSLPAEVRQEIEKLRSDAVADWASAARR